MKKNRDSSLIRFILNMLLLVMLVLTSGLWILHRGGKIAVNEPQQFVNRMLSGDRYLSPLQVADKIIQEDPSLLLIDLRDSDSYTAFSLPGAINVVPDSLIYSRQLLEKWNLKEVVLFANDEYLSNRYWHLAKQIGYDQIYVLKGGLNSWFEQVLMPNDPGSSATFEESKNHALSQAAAMHFGVQKELPSYILEEDRKAAEAKTKQLQAQKKQVKTKPKKKKRMPEGGC